MPTIYNVYCDESCHLENDGKKIMVIGAVWHPFSLRKEIATAILDLKERHSLGKEFEIKWTKISPSKIDFYKNLIDYFFEIPDLCYRAIIIPNKGILNHEDFNQDHDSWYYKMYFNMLKFIINPPNEYNIYIDIKDTHGGNKAKKLHDVLCNHISDFSRRIINKVQIIKSHESNNMQLADLLIGATSYINRNLESSVAKKTLTDKIIQRSGKNIKSTTWDEDKKISILRWTPQNR